MNEAGEDGYELWLRYRPVADTERMARYRDAIGSAAVLGAGPTAGIIRAELARALPVLLDRNTAVMEQVPAGGGLVAGTVAALAAAGIAISPAGGHGMGEEGFLIRAQETGGGRRLIVAGNSDVAVLRGTFQLLRLMQTQQGITALDITSCPRIRHRLLAHWDNLDGSVERGYAGRSLWNWDELPDTVDPRYHDYARACASIGINGTILNNVNASAAILTPAYLEKAAALAGLFRPYGLRVYLSPLLSAPVLLDGLSTSDPRDPAVSAWWRRKVDEIYRLIPDFGGFQVKASSEGQPGPQDYGAGHDDGANMLADALAPHGGLLLWRAFVYDVAVDADRAKCAYKEFLPLDGRFRPNVALQAKNGPVDFQPREPFHPLFGAMERTPLALELQVTQEYLGQSTHLAYLGGMWQEVLQSDTYAKGPGSTVAKVVDGSLHGQSLSAIVGVANTGSDRNWCGHHFAQANWYAFGRLAWDCDLSAEAVADEWTRLTWSNSPPVVDAIKTMLLGSREACVNYMTPLGLAHLMQAGHHYGPDPGFGTAKRPDWNNLYYHRADARGIGFDRTSGGSDAVSQYRSPLREQFNDTRTCPQELLLWFHHVPWSHRLPSGRTLWQELQQRYDAGVGFVEQMKGTWQGLRDEIDPRRHAHVSRRLEQQLENARLWRQVCLSYFGRFALQADRMQPACTRRHP